MSKLLFTSVTRSFITGNAFIGLTVIGSPCAKSSSRVLHISFGRPLISALQEPHRAALQFQRHARSGAACAWIQWMASRTTMPVSTGTLYSRNSPPERSPRKTLNVQSPVTKSPNVEQVPGAECRVISTFRNLACFLRPLRVLCGESAHHRGDEGDGAHLIPTFRISPPARRA